MSILSKYNFQPISFLDEDNRKKLEEFLTKNGEPGLHCGYESLHQYYTHKDNGCTDWTGFPASGKTKFLLQILYNLSIQYGKRHMMYVPDIGNYIETMAVLIKMHTGKDFHDKFNNKLMIEDVYKSIPFLNFHFIILKKKDVKKTVTPTDFWEYVSMYSDNEGIVHTGLIDSWKNMYNDMKERGYTREDQYLDFALSYRNELSEEYNKHFHTIAHATKTEIDDKGYDGKKKRRIPDANDIKGGGAWFANGKNIVTVDYPDKSKYGVDIYISKTKPEGVGRIGAIIDSLFLDPKRGQYYEVMKGRDVYSYKTDWQGNKYKDYEIDINYPKPEQASMALDNKAPF